jgi:hypothetical protein
MGRKRGENVAKNDEFRVIISIVALILALGIFLGGYKLYNVYGVEEPLKEAIAERDTVEAVQVSKDGKTYNINISLKKITNLQKEYLEIEKIICNKIEPGSFKLAVKGKSTQELDELQSSLKMALYEALANNRFVWLENEMASRIDHDRFSYRLYVDERHLYLQIEDGSGYWYEIFDRYRPETRTNADREA